LNVIVDTHALIWWWQKSPRFSKPAWSAIADHANTILISAASVYEFNAKFQAGKWPEVASIAKSFDAYLERSGFSGLPVTTAHARAAGLLPGPHRDPFDRLLIAQARIEGAAIVSVDPVFKSYGVQTLW
jgi:PIN domain nuclease of toxin-antitoxin system